MRGSAAGGPAARRRRSVYYRSSPFRFPFRRREFVARCDSIFVASDRGRPEAAAAATTRPGMDGPEISVCVCWCACVCVVLSASAVDAVASTQ